MNLWGRGSPRFPFIPQMQAVDFANYEHFNLQNAAVAWDMAHAVGFNQLCSPMAVAAAAAAAATPAAITQAPELFFEGKDQDMRITEPWSEGVPSPKQSQDGKPCHNFWQYKPPGTEEEEGAKKEFKEGKIAQYQNDSPRRQDKRDRERHRDRERRGDRESRSDRSRHRSKERREGDRDRQEGLEHREKKERDRSGDRKGRDKGKEVDKDQFGRDMPRRGGGRERERERERERSPKRKRTEEREREEEGKFSLEAANYKTQTPNETVMIRGLAQHITENDIRQDILLCGMMPKDIRLIRKKETGASRGFAFVEFNNVEEARGWMEHKQGVLMFQDQYRAVMQFSIVSNDNLPPVWMPTDWDCPKCYAHNFKKRVSCFKCHGARPSGTDGLECGNEVSPHPTTKLILRNLDVLTSEEVLLREISLLSNLPIQSCQIGRDTLTNLSKGVCYLEMRNVLEAIKLYNALTATCLVVDQRRVSVSYCKLHLDKSSSSTGLSSAWPAQTSETDYTLEDIPRLAQYSAQTYATTPQEHVQYLQYYTQYYTTQLSQRAASQLPAGTGTNAAAAVAQSAIKQAQSKKAVIAAVAAPTVPNYLSSKQLIGNTAVCEPDVASYTYDEGSGYFFDSQTGLYYDASSQYYYHSGDQVFLYWDSDRRAYMGAPSEQGGGGSEGGEGKEERRKDKGQDKVKVAKRIAKDMERWAKTLNQKKETAKMNAVAVQQAQAAAKSASTADIAFAVLERKDLAMGAAIQSALQFQQAVAQAQQPQSSTLVASYGGGSDSDEADATEDKPTEHTDWDKLACLLCKRAFPTREALVRHNDLSDLHKQNLETRNSETQTYRDRARERRDKFTMPEESKRNRLKEKYLKEKEEMQATSYEEPNKQGIPSGNLGNRMLQKMGWSEGMGLGRSNQGRTDIVQATQRVASAGLGIKGGNLGTPTGGVSSYKDNVKRAMMARYSELDD